MEKHYLNKFHRKHSEAALEEVEEMLEHPCSYEDALAQVQRIKAASEERKKNG